MVKEVITIAVGQCGIQTSNSAWELYCMEHGITADGHPIDEKSFEDDDSYQSFFQLTNRNHLTPRSLTCDLEATVVDEIRVGFYRNLFHPESIINGTEDASNNYARGRYTMGRAKIGTILDRIRKVAQNCEKLEGFVIINGYGGGTGSGLTDLITEKLNTEYSKRTKVQPAIFPGNKYSTSIIEPYNSILSVYAGIRDVDLAIQFDNDACYEIAKRHLGLSRPTYNNINRLISQVLSSVTCSIRFKNALDSDLTMMQVNMVPYPRIHFPVPAFSPFYMSDKFDHQNQTVVEVTRDVFDSTFQLATCDLLQGKFMACTLQYRGLCSPKNVNDAVADIKKRPEIQFVDWCPTGFKMGICRQPTMSVPHSEMSPCDLSVCCLANNTNVEAMWQKLIRKFQILYSKRAFVHWYVSEGMEEGEFIEAIDELKGICKDYKECGEEGGDNGTTGDSEKSKSTAASKSTQKSKSTAPETKSKTSNVSLPSKSPAPSKSSAVSKSSKNPNNSAQMTGITGMNDAQQQQQQQENLVQEDNDDDQEEDNEEEENEENAAEFD